MNSSIEWRRNIYVRGTTNAEIRACMMPSDDDVRAVTTIDENDVFGELRDAPGNYTYWLFLARQAEQDLKIRRKAVDILKKQVYEEHRNAVRSGGKAVTVKDAENLASINSLVLDAEVEVEKAESDYKYILAVVAGIEMKIQCLRSMNSRMNTEFEIAKNSQ